MQHLFRLGVDIDFSDDDGFTALHHAVLSGFEDCVQELINWGSDVNAMSQHGSPLNLAARKERGRVISILVSARADKARAVDFAVAHGQDVENLRSLLHLPVTETTVEPLSVDSAAARRERALELAVANVPDFDESVAALIQDFERRRTIQDLKWRKRRLELAVANLQDFDSSR